MALDINKIITVKELDPIDSVGDNDILLISLKNDNQYISKNINANNLPYVKTNVYATTELHGIVQIGDNLRADNTGKIHGNYANATLQNAGLMSKDDKAKLDAIAANANNYTLTPATQATLGGIKVGENLTVAADGTLNADAAPYVLPVATTQSLGGIQVGKNLTIENGTLNAAAPYELPEATTTSLGGIKVGKNLTIENGTLNADAAPYVLPVATTKSLGGIQVGDHLKIDDKTGKLDVVVDQTTLPVASSTLLGAIKVGDNLSIDNRGVLNVNTNKLGIPTKVSQLENDKGYITSSSFSNIKIEIVGSVSECTNENTIYFILG